MKMVVIQKSAVKNSSMGVVGVTITPTYSGISGLGKDIYELIEVIENDVEIRCEIKSKLVEVMDSIEYISRTTTLNENKNKTKPKLAKSLYELAEITENDDNICYEFKEGLVDLMETVEYRYLSKKKVKYVTEQHEKKLEEEKQDKINNSIKKRRKGLSNAVSKHLSSGEVIEIPWNGPKKSN